MTNALVTFTKKFWHTRFWSLQTNFEQTRFSSLQKRTWHKLASASFLFYKESFGKRTFYLTKNFWHTRFWSLQTNFRHTRFSFLQKRIWHELAYESFSTETRGTQAKLSFENAQKQKFNFWKWQKWNFCQIHCGACFQENFSVSYEYHSFQCRNCLEFEKPYHQDHIWETNENIEIGLLFSRRI